MGVRKGHRRQVLEENAFMSSLFGLITNKPADLALSLRGPSADHPNVKPAAAWGIGWYENSQARVFKEGLSAIDKGSKFPTLSKQVRSKIIVAHVRKGTGAPPAAENSLRESAAANP